MEEMRAEMRELVRAMAGAITAGLDERFERLEQLVERKRVVRIVKRRRDA